MEDNIKALEGLHSPHTITSGAGYNVMVVDDDVVCLSIVAGILRACKYQVVTAKNPLDALATLRAATNFFHIVVTDVHMPEMNGFDFQKRVQEDFHLPVVMMSADDKESSILRGLQSGASIYFVKPVNFNDLKNIWQFSVTSEKDKEKGKSVDIQEGGCVPVEEPPVEEPPTDRQESPAESQEPPVDCQEPVADSESPHEEPLDNVIDLESVSFVNGVNQSRRDSKKKASKRPIIQDSENDSSDAVLPKRRKIVWTSALHNRFLEAVRKIGLERAVPKRILELMNTSEVTRENIASHLQKYRLFLRRVAEASNNSGTIKGKNIIERTLRSSFATGHPSLLLTALQKGFPQLLNQHIVGSLLLQGIPENAQLVDDPIITAAIFPNQQASTNNPNQQASTSNPVPQLGNIQQAKDQVILEANGGEMINGENPGEVNDQQQTQPGLNNLSQNLDSSSSNNNNNNNMAAGSDEMEIETDHHDVSNGVNGNHDSITGNNGDRNLASATENVNAQGGGSSVGLSDGNQQNDNNNNNNNNNNGGESSSSYLLDRLMNTTAPLEGLSPNPFFESDFDEIFQTYFNNLNNKENKVEEEVQSQAAANLNNPVENNPPEIQLPSNQIEYSGGYMMGYTGNGIDQLDEYFLNYEQPRNTNQQQGGGNYQQPAPYRGYPAMRPAWNQGSKNDFMDSMFGRRTF